MLAELKRSSAAYAILEYAYFNYAFTSKDAYMSLYAYKTDPAIAAGLKQLKEREYVEEVPGVKGFWRISERGSMYMARQGDYYRDGKGRAPRLAPAELRKQETQLRIQAFMCGAGVSVYPKDKVSFADFISIAAPGSVQNHLRYRDGNYFPLTEEEIGNELSDGIYYSRREIMDGISETGRGIEPFMTTSVVGAVFTTANIYLVYYTDKYAVTWRYNESRLVEMLESVFAKEGRYKNRSPICIYTGKTYAMAHAFGTCYIHGRMRYEKAQDTKEKTRLLELESQEVVPYMQMIEDRRETRAKNAANFRAIAKSSRRADNDGFKNRFNFFNAENTDFREIYYVPVKKQHIGTLAHILQSDISTLIKEGDSWFAEHKGFSQTADAHNIVCGTHAATDQKVAFLPVAEIKSLYALRKSKDTVSVVTVPELADCISHILGRNLGTVYSMEGEEITVERYDEYGYRLNGDIYEQMAQTNREKAAKRLELGIEKKTPITVRIPESSYENIRRLAEGSGQSISAYTGRLISFALEHIESTDKEQE